MIIEHNRVVLEQKDLEKIFQGVFTTKDDFGRVSNSLFSGELIFALKKEFTTNELNFTIPDINVKNTRNSAELSYKCSITDYDSIDGNFDERKYEGVGIYDLFEGGYYLLQYNYDDPKKQGIVIDIDRDELSKFKLTYL